jgi:hypothetical protein
MLLNKSMRMIALVLFSAIFFSCEDPKNIGLPLGGGDYTTTFTDTLTVNTSTTFIDSTATDGNESILVGRVDDLIFGKNTTKGNWQVTLPASASQFSGVSYLDYTLVENTEYDSVYVYLQWNGFVQGDTTKPITLSLHRLTAELDKNKRLQSTDKAPFNPTPIVTKTFTYKDFKRSVATGATLDSVIRFKMPNEFGRELFALAGKYKAADNAQFMTDFKGLSIVASNAAAAIYGFALDESSLNTPSGVRMFVHKTGETTAQSITFRAREKKYTEIVSDRVGTETERFKDKGVAISSKLTNSKSYFQTGVGITTKFDIPYLKRIISASTGRIAINKAELVVTPDENTTGVFLPPFQLSLGNVDVKNQLIYTSNVIQFVPFDGSGGSGGFSIGYNSTDKKYTFNITNYVQNILNGKTANDSFVMTPYYAVASATGTNGIFISHPNLRRMVINNKNVKLNIYYSAPTK